VIAREELRWLARDADRRRLGEPLAGEHSSTSTPMRLQGDLGRPARDPRPVTWPLRNSGVSHPPATASRLLPPASVPRGTSSDDTPPLPAAAYLTSTVTVVRAAAPAMAKVPAATRAAVAKGRALAVEDPANRKTSPPSLAPARGESPTANLSTETGEVRRESAQAHDDHDVDRNSASRHHSCTAGRHAWRTYRMTRRHQRNHRRQAIAASCDRLRQLTITVESGDDPAYAGILRESTRDLL